MMFVGLDNLRRGEVYGGNFCIVVFVFFQKKSEVSFKIYCDNFFLEVQKVVLFFF